MNSILQLTDAFEFLSKQDDSSINLIVTDPPYGINFKGETSNTDWDNLDYKDFLTRFLTEVKRVLAKDGVMWMFCARTEFLNVCNIINEVGLENHLENWMTWARQKGRGTSTKLKSQAEEILYITKKGAKPKFYKVEYLREVVIPYVKDGKARGWFLDQSTGMRVRWSGVGNVLAFASPFFNSKFEKQIHSCQKPVLLLCELIMLSSKKGDLVVDPFFGSGSTAVAAEISGRRFLGSENDAEMFEKAKNWVENIDYELAKEYIDSRIHC